MLQIHTPDIRIQGVVSSDLETLVCNRQGPDKRPVAERVGDNLQCGRRVLFGKKIRSGSCCTRNFDVRVWFDRRPNERSFFYVHVMRVERVGVIDKKEIYVMFSVTFIADIFDTEALIIAI